ncbi:MAG: hypothetical protein JSV74_03405 [Dehalococcoidia bacterium]|nr:MAG: hypothetical protein JSV74_03405 [Dehalococcoidia bacterium]
MSIDPRRVGRFALIGAGGFGISGLIIGLAIEAAGRVDWKNSTDIWESMPIFLLPLFMLLAGAVAGTVLGFALERRMGCIFAVLMGIAYFPGILVIGWILRWSDFVNNIPFATLFGLMLGMLLGFTTGKWQKLLLLALAGSIGGVVSGAVTNPIASYDWYIVTVQGAIGGAFLGGAIGLIQKEKGKNTD